MSDNNLERSLSLNDAECFQYMFAEGWTPGWNALEEATDFNTQDDGWGQQYQSAQLSLQQMPWTNSIDQSTDDTWIPTEHGQHSPMINGSAFTTTSSTSSTYVPPIAQPYFHTAEPATQHTEASHAGSHTFHTFRVQPQPLAPALPTTSHNNLWPLNPSQALARQPRPPSPHSQEMLKYGSRNTDGTWSCRYDKCTSHIRFRRKCDLRKHFLRHLTRYYCCYSDCNEAEGRGSGFSSKKDCVRHEQKHDPKIVCEWETCTRVFSRRDNMRDHMKRMHLRPKLRRRATTAD